MVNPDLQLALAQARTEDFRRAAAARNLARLSAEPRPTRAPEKRITLRFGVTTDAEELARLAALDSSKRPEYPILLAEVDGQILATLGLSDGTVVANPFHRTADLIDLLRARARQLHGGSVRRSHPLRSWFRMVVRRSGLRGDRVRAARGPFDHRS